MENEPNVEPAAGVVSKEADAAESLGELVPPKKKRRMSQGPDKMKLNKATPCVSSTTISLHHTGVPKALIGKRSGSDGQSIYRCQVEGCNYSTVQYAQLCTHIRRKHLGVCLKCRLCERRSYRSVDLQKHMKDVHMNDEAKWFEPVPALEGDIIEVNEATLQENIALVKKEITPDDDEEEED